MFKFIWISKVMFADFTWYGNYPFTLLEGVAKLVTKIKFLWNFGSIE